MTSVDNDLAALEAAKRRAQVVALRRERLTFAQIGERMGFSTQRAHELYQRAIAEAPVRQVDEHRAEEVELIDTAIRDLLLVAGDHSDPRSSVAAWNAIRGWAERKAKLLGLDAPLKVQALTLDVIDAEIARLEAELASANT